MLCVYVCVLFVALKRNATNDANTMLYATNYAATAHQIKFSRQVSKWRNWEKLTNKATTTTTTNEKKKRVLVEIDLEKHVEKAGNYNATLHAIHATLTTTATMELKIHATIKKDLKWNARKRFCYATNMHSKMHCNKSNAKLYYNKKQVVAATAYSQ